METFETMLNVGGHQNSLGRAGEVLDTVRNDLSRLDELFECISSDDAWVRMRAVDTFEKLVKSNPELAKPYTSVILGDLTNRAQPSIQWHLAQLFAEIELNEEQRDIATNWMKSTIMTTRVDWIVSVNTMKTLLYFYKNQYVSRSELSPLFELQTTHTSKTVRKKAAEFLHNLSGDS